MKDECQICGSEENLEIHQEMTKCQRCIREYESGRNGENELEDKDSFKEADWKERVAA